MTYGFIFLPQIFLPREKNAVDPFNVSFQPAVAIGDNTLASTTTTRHDGLEVELSILVN